MTRALSTNYIWGVQDALNMRYVHKSKDRLFVVNVAVCGIGPVFEVGTPGLSIGLLLCQNFTTNLAVRPELYRFVSNFSSLPVGMLILKYIATSLSVFGHSIK